MRGGLDDALDKLARRDELRRRAAGEATGTSPAVTELVEAIAAVVGRHPELGVTVGAEGSGEPILLHFFYADGQVQVSADSPPLEESPPARHAEIVDVDLDDPVETYRPTPDQMRRHQDDQDRYGAPQYGYTEPAAYYSESDTAERRYGSFDGQPADTRYPSHSPGETSRDLGARMRDLGMASRAPSAPSAPPAPTANGPVSGSPLSSSPLAGSPFSGSPLSGSPLSGSPLSGSPLSGSAAGVGPAAGSPLTGPLDGTRLTSPHSGSPVSGSPMSGGPMSGSPMSGSPMPPGPAPSAPQYPPHPFAATPPPPVPPQSSPRPPSDAQATRRIHAEQHRAPAEPAATERIIPPQPQPQRGAMPTPLPKPIPLQVERPEETEMAARRLAALLRDDPSLLNQAPRGE
ncbi:hypothetical protein ACQP2F_45205 [Actinoplanes sp. CA-030573]|uniref:hypothetical protein n=1 Tax=Actinoplanes sp. CA-030573 TaxID=3239898 RepID=UPI003D90E385